MPANAIQFFMKYVKITFNIDQKVQLFGINAVLWGPGLKNLKSAY